jgi:catechol 2,3-dioxygenase-like lactoylglutathione lyase family enzyme
MAFAGTTKPEQARRFYEDLLGLTLMADEPMSIVYDCNGTMLRIAKVQALTPPGHTALGWIVADVRSKVTELERKGVAFQRYPGLEQDELGICAFPDGTQVAWFQDPDGNTLSLTQFEGS